MIAHRLSTIENVDCIYVLKNGKIAEYGNRKKLMEKNGIFAQMFNDYNSAVEWKVAKEEAK